MYNYNADFGKRSKIAYDLESAEEKIKKGKCKHCLFLFAPQIKNIKLCLRVGVKNETIYIGALLRFIFDWKSAYVFNRFYFRKNR